MQNGAIREVLKFDKGCYAFFEAGGEKLVVFLDNLRAILYENGKLVRTCSKSWRNQHSAFLEYNKLYFSTINWASELIEWNLDTFEEKQLMRDASQMSGPPREPSFAAISANGLLQAKHGRRQLSEAFPKMGESTWNTVFSIDQLAVVTGYSKSCLLTGNELPKERNFFLLVNLTNLEVVNHANPLTLEWRGIGTRVF